MDMDSSNNIIPAGSDNIFQWRHNENVRHAHVNRGDATIRAEYEQIIQKALNAESEAADASAVEQARAELRSGQLDSPEAITEAARNIIRFGI